MQPTPVTALFLHHVRPARPTMILLRTPGILLVVLMLASTACARAQPSECIPNTPAEFDRCLERHAQALLAEGFPSFSFGVVREDTLVYVRSFGVADRETGAKATSRTLYQIGSVTKMFTGLLFARMVETGAVRLSDPIASYLPEGVTIPTDSAGAVITLQHVATHTAGLPRYPPNLDRTDGDPMVGFSEEELYEGLAQSELVHPIGTTWSYSNFGYGLLAHVMARAGGASFEELLRRYVLTPPALHGITLDPSEEQRRRMATPYRDDDPEVATQPWDMGTLSGAGALFASVEDLGAFMVLLMQSSSRRGDPDMRDALRLMQTPFYRFRNGDYTSWGYGFGTFIVEDWQGSGERVIWHGGDLDGYAAAVLAAPAAGVGVVYLTNSSIGPVLSESGLNEWLLPAAIYAFRD